MMPRVDACPRFFCAGLVALFPHTSSCLPLFLFFHFLFVFLFFYLLVVFSFFYIFFIFLYFTSVL
jgi:hypothetical protein